MNRKQLVALLGLLLPVSAEAGRPLVVDDAHPVEFKKLQLEAGVAYFRENGDEHLDVPVQLGYGLTPRIEIAAAFGGHWKREHDEFDIAESATGVTDLIFGGKWKFADQEKFFADQALTLTVNVPTASENDGLSTGETDVDVTYVLSRSIGDKLMVDLNLGYLLTGGRDNPDYFHYGLALEYQLTEHLQPVWEIYAFTAPDDASDTSVGTTAGIRWLAAENLVFDAAIGTKVHGDLPDLLTTVGLTWVF